MMIEFAVRHPLIILLLFWLMGFLGISLEKSSDQILQILSFILAAMITVLFIGWPLAVYKYVLKIDISMDKYVRSIEKYGRNDFDIWFILMAIILICIIVMLEAKVVHGTFYEIIVAIISVAWYIILFILIWRVSKILSILHNQQYAVSSHVANFLGVLFWPCGGILFLREKLLELR